MYENIPVMLVVIESRKLKGTINRRPIAGNIDDMYRLTSAGKGTIISDALQAYHHLKLGDTIELPTPDGMVSAPHPFDTRLRFSKSL